MAKANHAHTISSMLDAIAPSRIHFNVINGNRPPSTNEVIERIAKELAAQGPVFPDIPKEPRLPGVTSYGKITDQPVFTAAVLYRIAAKKGGVL